MLYKIITENNILNETVPIFANKTIPSVLIIIGDNWYVISSIDFLETSHS